VGEGYATCASVRMATQWSAVIAYDAGNLLEVARALVRRYPGVRLVLLADDDHATPGNPGVSKATAAAKVVRGQVAVPRFASSAPDRGTDWNDLHVAEGLEQVRDQLLALRAEWEQAAPPAQPRPAGAGVIDGHFPGVEWVRRLQLTDKGQVRATSFNTRLILENDPAWRDVLGWCEFSHTIQKKTAPPLRHAARGEWEDADDAGLRYWLAERYGIEPKGQDLADAVNGAAMDNAFHPVCDYLDALIWDGVPRLYRWLRYYLGAGEESLPEDEVALEQGRYLELVGTMYLIQAVSRVRRPGLKADAVLILEGPQGRGKSTALRQLFGDDWFSDTPIDIGSKDAYESIRGLWGFEMAELDSLNKADSTRAKAFFSSPRDRFRMPYGHRAKNYNRQCVIAGTTNHYSHLKDYSGNRRFWSVGVGDIDLEALARDRDQLWAEADHRYRAGQAWWPEQDDLPLFEEQQDARLDADVWETVIQQWLKEQLLLVPPAARPQYTVTAAELMAFALKVEMGMMRRPEQTRVGLIMAGLGWRPCRLGRGAERMRGYRPGTAYLASMGAPGALGPRF
jgi:putative DNA primase/helicase